MNYSGKREKRKLIYFSERKNNQGLKAVHSLHSGSNAKEEYDTRIQNIKYTSTSSSRMANVSAAYHTLLLTYRINGLSILEYLKKFFHEIVKGRKNYENLLPVTIGISTNKYQ